MKLSREASDKDELISKLRDELEDVKAEMKVKRETLSGLNDELKETTVKIEEREGDVENLKEKVVELENLKESLKNKLEETENRLQEKNQLSEDLGKKVQDLDRQLLLLRQDYDEADSARKLTETIQKSASISNDENDRLNALVKKFMQEKESLIKENTDKSTELFTIGNEMEKLQGAMNEKLGENEKMASEIETLKSKIVDLEKEQVDSKKVEENFSKSLQGTREELETQLKQQNELYRKLRSEMDNEVKLRYDADSKNDTLEKDNDKLTKKVEEQDVDLKSSFETISGYCKKVKELEDENRKLKKISQTEPVEQICKDMKQLQSPSRASNQKYTYEQVEKEAKRLKARNDRLQKSVTDVNNKNRQYQDKLKKYYKLCQDHGLIKKEGVASKPATKVDGKGGVANKAFTGSQNSINSSQK